MKMNKQLKNKTWIYNLTPSMEGHLKLQEQYLYGIFKAELFINSMGL